MGIFLDILSGRIFNFRNANGADINAGISDDLIVTPKALSQSDVFGNTSIPLVLPASLSSRTTRFKISPYIFLIPISQRPKIKAQIFAFTIVDKGCAGEICLLDANTNDILKNTAFSFNNTNWSCVYGKSIELEVGKTYKIAIRKMNKSFCKKVQLQAATIILKLLSQP